MMRYHEQDGSLVFRYQSLFHRLLFKLTLIYYHVMRS